LLSIALSLFLTLLYRFGLAQVHGQKKGTEHQGRRPQVVARGRVSGPWSSRRATSGQGKLLFKRIGRGWAVKIGGGKQKQRLVSIISEELGYEYIGDVDSDSEEE